MILRLLWLFSLIGSCVVSTAQSNKLNDEVKSTMLKSTKFMLDSVSTNGGFVWFYLPDNSRRWGELEAYKSQVWLQSPGGTIDMGNTFLDAYNVTKDEFYYRAAEKVGQVLIWGQLPVGGWNYTVDFGGDRSVKNWYNTIGKNAWGFEEYYHFYGNATFDDGVSASAASFLLRLYLQKQDIQFLPALEKAIKFVKDSQYPLGGWPQRYPLKYDYPHTYETDYTSFYTFNDGVIINNIGFLINCYNLLNREDLLDNIKRGMNFYLLSLGGDQAGWGEQHNMNLEPDHGRSYEPPALFPGTTSENAKLLMKFYQYTGDSRFISRIPDIIQWLEKIKLPENETDNGRYTHPTFIEVGTNRALFVHRSGTNVTNGKYWWDYKDENPLLHYGAKTRVDIAGLKSEYEKLRSLQGNKEALDEMKKKSPLSIRMYENDEATTPQEFFKLNPYSLDIMDLQMLSMRNITFKNKNEIEDIVKQLNKSGYWPVKHMQITRPYSIDANGNESNTAKLSDANGRSIVDSTEQEYISTREYIQNMQKMISYLKAISK